MRVHVPLDIDIDHARHLVHTKADGTIVLQELLDYFDKVVIEGCLPYSKLFDASRAEFALSDEDMMVLGARVSAYGAMEPRGPIALIVGSDEVNDLGRRFANLGGARRPMRIFRSAEEGRIWLQTEPAAQR
jgi:hypothetical protein